jgi:hypothetical protein
MIKLSAHTWENKINQTMLGETRDYKYKPRTKV